MAVSTSLHHMQSDPRGHQKPAPRPATAQHPTGHPAAHHPPAHPHAEPPHKAHPHPPVVKKKSHWLVYTLLAATILGIGGVFFAMRSSGPTKPTPEALVQQIEDTAISAAPPTNVYGGMIFSDHGSPPSVTVAGIPNKACVSAGWRLARSGLVTINGVMPERVSAAILAELCNQGDANALSWSPKKEN